jgi:DNA recombination protein RmuC
MNLVLIALASFAVLILLVVLWRQLRTHQHSEQLKQQVEQQQTILIRLEERSQNNQNLAESVSRLLNEHQRNQQQERNRLDEHQLRTLKTLQDSLQGGMVEVRRQVTEALTQHATTLNQRVEQLTQSTDQRLKEISGQVEKRLADGFEKTNATFTDVVKRLALIDEAQKKITELSTNVVSLQAIFTDKRARGAFGEVQLEDLVRNVLPAAHFSFQHTLSNSKRVDCLLRLPEPTGCIAIDAKFPLENYHLMMAANISEMERQQYEQNFKRDIQKHIRDIAEKYIVPGETADSAVMFIPAEAIFAEIHAHYPDVVNAAQKAHVWIVSPTTMWAILTTARAVIKDVATRKQIHIIQKHLQGLNEDFGRFKIRMDNLAKHIAQAHEDTKDVQISSKKISAHFHRIEKVELTAEDAVLLVELPNENTAEE